jgi:hypothetical protein
MDSLFTEIHYRLIRDSRVGTRSLASGGTIVYSHVMLACSNASKCRMYYTKGSNGHHKMALRAWFTCDKCSDAFSEALPATGTFLERRAIVNMLAMGDNVVGCLYCFRKKKYIDTASTICAGCGRAHQQEEDELIEKRMIMGEVLGADCAGVVTGYLPYFFGWPRRAKNEIGTQEHK